MHYAAHNTAKDVTREAGEARRCNWKLYYRQICPFWRCGQILDYFGQCTSSTADGGKWQLGVSSTNCWTVPRYRESKNFLSANCNDPTTDDYALSTQLLSDFRWGASSMRHNPQRWQEQLLMELLSDLRSQGGIISAFILPIPIVITLKNRVLMECMTQQRRRGWGLEIQPGGRRAGQKVHMNITSVILIKSLQFYHRLASKSSSYRRRTRRKCHG